MSVNFNLNYLNNISSIIKNNKALDDKDLTDKEKEVLKEYGITKSNDLAFVRKQLKEIGAEGEAERALVFSAVEELLKNMKTEAKGDTNKLRDVIMEVISKLTSDNSVTDLYNILELKLQELKNSGSNSDKDSNVQETKTPNKSPKNNTNSDVQQLVNDFVRCKMTPEEFLNTIKTIDGVKALTTQTDKGITKVSFEYNNKQYVIYYNQSAAGNSGNAEDVSETETAAPTKAAENTTNVNKTFVETPVTADDEQMLNQIISSMTLQTIIPGYSNYTYNDLNVSDKEIAYIKEQVRELGLEYIKAGMLNGATNEEKFNTLKEYMYHEASFLIAKPMEKDFAKARMLTNEFTNASALRNMLYSDKDALINLLNSYNELKNYSNDEEKQAFVDLLYGEYGWFFRAPITDEICAGLLDNYDLLVQGGITNIATTYVPEYEGHPAEIGYNSPNGWVTVLKLDDVQIEEVQKYIDGKYTNPDQVFNAIFEKVFKAVEEARAQYENITFSISELRQAGFTQDEINNKDICVEIFPGKYMITSYVSSEGKSPVNFEYTDVESLKNAHQNGPYEEKAVNALLIELTNMGLSINNSAEEKYFINCGKDGLGNNLYKLDLDAIRADFKDSSIASLSDFRTAIKNLQATGFNLRNYDYTEYTEHELPQHGVSEFYSGQEFAKYFNTVNHGDGRRYVINWAEVIKDFPNVKTPEEFFEAIRTQKNEETNFDEEAMLEKAKIITDYFKQFGYTSTINYTTYEGLYEKYAFDSRNTSLYNMNQLGSRALDIKIQYKSHVYAPNIIITMDDTKESILAKCEALKEYIDIMKSFS